MADMFDVAIIGAGTAGLAALREVRKRTSSFVIFNDGPWGTVCARVGCMPSKTLIEAANAYHRRHTFEEFGIRGSSSLSPDMAAVLRRVRRLRDDFVAGTVEITEALGERAISGRARLLGPDRLEINGRELRARNIIVATGSRPIIPSEWRALNERLLTTDTLFEQETLPSRMAVIGLGPAGIEMAQALSRLGIEVVGFGKKGSIAGLTDPRVNATAIELLRDEFTLHLGEKADLKADGSHVRVRAGREEAAVDRVLVSLGRQPNIDGLGLETLGVELDAHGLPPLDPHTTRVANLPVFIAGDVNTRKPLLHEAADDGHIAGINATRPAGAGFTRRVPLGIVFADPNIATVGRTFASSNHDGALTGEVLFNNQGRARAGQRNKGILRLYAQNGNGRLLGAEICAPAGEHMAHLLALAIERSLTVHDMLRMPFYHPVLEEGLRTALRQLSKQLPDCAESDLAGCESFDVEALD